MTYLNQNTDIYNNYPKSIHVCSEVVNDFSDSLYTYVHSGNQVWKLMTY